MKATRLTLFLLTLLVSSPAMAQSTLRGVKSKRGKTSKTSTSNDEKFNLKAKDGTALSKNAMLSIRDRQGRVHQVQAGAYLDVLKAFSRQMGVKRAAAKRSSTTRGLAAVATAEAERLRIANLYSGVVDRIQTPDLSHHHAPVLRAIGAPRRVNTAIARRVNVPALQSIRPAVGQSLLLENIDQPYSHTFGDRDWVALRFTAFNRAKIHTDKVDWSAQAQARAYVLGRSRSLFRGDVRVRAEGETVRPQASLNVVGQQVYTFDESFETYKRKTFSAHWEQEVELFTTTVRAAFVPINVGIWANGAAGLRYRAKVGADLGNLRKSSRIFGVNVTPLTTTVGNQTFEGAYAALGLRGSAEISLSLTSVIGWLGVDSTYVDLALSVLHLDGEIASAGVEVRVNLIKAEMPLNADIALNYDFRRRGFSVDGFVQAELCLEVISDLSVVVYASVTLPVDVDIEWWGPIPTDVSVRWREFRRSHDIAPDYAPFINESWMLADEEFSLQF